MTPQCAAPISDELLIAYWARDLDEATSATIEEHFFGCAACSARLERIAVLAQTMRELISPVLSQTQVAELRARGMRIFENPVLAGTRVPVSFPADSDLMIHVLRGLDLSRAESVGVVVSDEDSGMLMMMVPSVPFNRASGEVLMACQRDYAVFPPNVVFEVVARDASGTEERTRFVVPHVFT